MERIADYTLVRSLGTGNNGEFFLAVPPRRLGVDAEFVAVKVLAGTRSDETFRRATKELRAFASVPSPYLVTLFDAGREGDTFFYSMEYFPLGSLGAPARPLERAEVIRAVADAARAAHALHEQGIAHRDIKPDNVMLHAGGGKLSDLGLSQALAPGQTITGIGSSLGSIEYIDPDLMRGQRASRATDIWALGLTLHRVVSGKGVYGDLPDRDPLLAVRKILSTPPTIDATLDAETVAVVADCIAEDASVRLDTAAELAERIDALVRLYALNAGNAR